MNALRVMRCVGRLLLLAVLGFSNVVRAADARFFDLSPGPLSHGHAELDTAEGCKTCHKPGVGVLASLCLGCHTHRDLAKAIAAGEGLHADFKQSCLTCHTEHKGATAVISSWASLGGQEHFDHKKAGFALDAKHGHVACSACHLKRLRSGRTSYTGLSPKCASCHGGVHGFTRRDFKEGCELCHPAGLARKPAPSALPFNHATQAGLALEGKHATVACTACHKGARMAKPAQPRTCASCHKSPHGRGLPRDKCAECHLTAQPFKESKFDHNSTGYPLVGAHRTPNCKACHKSPGRKPSKACASCHQDPHRKRFEKKTCVDCHQAGGIKRTSFDHTKLTKFPLTGRHETLPCRSCHRGASPQVFERFASTECGACHAHAKAHQGQFADKKCLDCHREGGSKALKFDHNRDARFRLEERHRQVANEGKCSLCHPDGRFRTGKGKCIDCHAKHDQHKGKLGADCARCHTPSKGATKFKHEQMTGFVREGKHAALACAFCHRAPPGPEGPPKVGWTTGIAAPKVDKLFPVMGKTCSECHFDPHRGERGNQCRACHKATTFKDATGADHDTGMFRLTGRHDVVECVRCHADGQRLAGTGDMCANCHDEDDTHRGALGPACGDCHRQNEWTPSSFSHTMTGMPLRGAHLLASCDGCHALGNYFSVPSECASCHAAVAATVSSPIHTAELDDCEACHSETTFAPARRYHPTFPLLGQHATAACADCHIGGQYAGTAATCEACHLDDHQAAATEPNHVAAGFGTFCEECHIPADWSIVRYEHAGFVMGGLHRTLSCDTCHTGGLYDSAFSGLVTTFDCALCHGPAGPVSSWPELHGTLGYPSDCAMCHEQSAWVPARATP